MFKTLTLADALSVVSRMRERDRQCVRAAMGQASDEAVAVGRWQTDGPAWSLWDERGPQAIGGLSFQNGWSAVFWLFATDDMRGNSWRKLIRHTRTVIANVTAPAHGRHRIEAHVLSEWSEAREFARRLGFELEGVRRAAGAGGEDIEIWTPRSSP
jgi:hypothetical protein